MTIENPSEIALRCYTERPDAEPVSSKGGQKALDEPSPWVLVFDTETTTCPAQSLRVGSYQVRHGDTQKQEGLFYDPESVSDGELATLIAYTERHGVKLITIDQFRRLFLKIGYKLNATVVGFNLPFDISRIALSHGEARGSMRGGFTFKLSPYKDQPYVRVKQLSARAALIDFAKPGKQQTPRGMRNRGLEVQAHRGFFVDVKTLAASLTSCSFSLEGLCDHLGVATRKKASDEHGGPLTPSYLDYARADVQATWECYGALMAQYASHGLETPAHHILSEASIGKAYLKQMGVQPLLACQPDFPRRLFGKIMGSYYGGRAEVRDRKVPTEVAYCDFKSMYPTVNSLMGLWSFVIADGMSWTDSTEVTQTFLDRITLGDLQNPRMWNRLRTLVRIKPHQNLFPVRAKYNEKTYTIGINYLTCGKPLWYTLADCVASKILTGKTPIIDEALTFEPGPPQDGLEPIDLFGDPVFRVDPAEDDVFNRLIDLRDQAKTEKNPVQQQIKIVANATSYGIFVEVQRDDLSDDVSVLVYDQDGIRHEIKTKAVEQPGKYFHPLLATLITGAARLMLACAEKLTEDQGLGWAFCDTDSLAVARPEGMSREEFRKRTGEVVDWFDPLNPYRKPGSILQMEDVNFDAEGDPQPLYAYAISAKRYALFNLSEDGKPVLRKASAHGLGHLLQPYGEDDPAIGVPSPTTPLHVIGVKRWQYDLWYKIIEAALAGVPNRLCLDYHPAFDQPAISRYGATSPALLRWMKPYNEGRDYRDQIKPFGFLVSLTAKLGVNTHIAMDTFTDPHQRGRPTKQPQPKPVSTFEKQPRLAAETAFDRETGEPVSIEQLKTYRESLSRYHLSTEDKFENADFTDTGVTKRRHIVAGSIRLIGKEANKVGEAGQADPVVNATCEFQVETDVNASHPATSSKLRRCGCETLETP